MTLVERRVDLHPVLGRIVRVGFAATDARGTGLDAPGTTVIPERDTAVRIGLRSAATQSIEAITLGFLCRTELADELAVLEMTATLAIVMDGLPEDLLRLALIGQLGNLADEQYVDQNGDEMLGVARATGNVDDRRCNIVLTKELLNAESIGGIRRCAHPTAIDGA